MKLALIFTTAATLYAAELGSNSVTVHDVTVHDVTVHDVTVHDVTVHEWGTFTSVAGANGDPVQWAPLNGKPDLPCFVTSIDRQPFKYWPGTIRMETPVLYFYAQRPATLNVRVDFPQGWVTEWYPQAASNIRGPQDVGHGRIEWNGVQVVPGADLIFPMGESPTHYYTARATDAAPLRIGDQQEKMIFYRGIGHFQPALRPRYIEDGRIELRNAGEFPIAAAIVFENRDGRAGYRIVRDLRESAVVDTPALTAGLADLPALMQRELQALGMYEKEAASMVETWRDSWFEEGTRVFYFLPPADVDKHLPLTITPAPANIARAFVGRVELLSPATRERVKSALATNDRATIERLGRFLDPFAKAMGMRIPEWAQWRSEGPVCVE